jgi:hypothetical protein
MRIPVAIRTAAVESGAVVGVAVGVVEGSVVAVGVAETSRVAVVVGVGVTGQPFSAFRTALTISSTVTNPSAVESKLGHWLTGWLPSAMAMPRTSSSTVTVLSVLQSPTQLETVPALAVGALWQRMVQAATSASAAENARNAFCMSADVVLIVATTSLRQPIVENRCGSIV